MFAVTRLVVYERVVGAAALLHEGRILRNAHFVPYEIEREKEVVDHLDLAAVAIRRFNDSSALKMDLFVSVDTSKCERASELSLS